MWLQMLKQFLATPLAQEMIRKVIEHLLKGVPAGTSASVASFTGEQVADATDAALDEMAS